MSNEGFRAPEPDLERGTTHTESPTPALFLTRADAVNARLAAQRRERERKQQTIVDRRNRDDQRNAIFAEADRRRRLQVAEGRIIAGTATQHDVRRLNRAGLNEAFEARHADLHADLENDETFAVARRCADNVLTEPAYAGASAEILADVIAEGCSKTPGATRPPRTARNARCAPAAAQ